MSKFGSLLRSGAAAAVIAGAASSAQAGWVTVTIPDSGEFEFFGQGDASVTYDGVTFSQSAALGDANFFNIGSDFAGDPPVLSSQEETVGVANILITLPQAAVAVQLNYGTFNGSDVTFTFPTFNVVQGSTGSGYAVPDFFSASGQPFTTLQLTSPDYVLNLGTVSYETTVPEASTWAMMMLGFAGLGFAGYRASRKTAPVAL